MPTLASRWWGFLYIILLQSRPCHVRFSSVGLKRRHRRRKAKNRQINTVKGGDGTDLTKRGVCFCFYKIPTCVLILQVRQPLKSCLLFRVQSEHFRRGKVTFIVGSPGGRLFEQLRKTSVITPILKIRVPRLRGGPGTPLPSTTCVLHWES